MNKAIIILLLIISSCNNKNKKEMNIIEATQLGWDINRYNDLKEIIGKDKREIFIVVNPTTDEKEIEKIIKENEKKLQINKELVEDKYIHFYRAYYKESKKTPIDFVEDPGGFAVNILEDHKDDFLCSIAMHKKNILGKEKLVEWENTCKK